MDVTLMDQSETTEERRFIYSKDKKAIGASSNRN